ncbi:VOC family protein [Polycladidibacter hongkongensis]|uniref:VOC family protein n=1 Tax=Polycladidibacter hongkongensis TaxID=1647556 RepID=UPI0008376197|nr:VOC family protein [Pseudovibrio hongkongensis]
MKWPIDYLELPAKDLELVREFYSCVFQWKFTSYGEDYIAFKAGEREGGFYRSTKTSDSANGAALIVFYSKDLQETLECILVHGGSIAKETFSFPGGRRFHFYDPTGNELAVWSDR